jgi:hypothetical protein
MPYPVDNNLISAVWIGDNVLPDDVLATVLRYATVNSRGLNIMLWVDHPAKIQSQFIELGYALTHSKLSIVPITELFSEDVREPLALRSRSNQLNNLQERERYGEGNIGARVDLIKAQIAYKVGGVIADFDTLDAIYMANNKHFRDQFKCMFSIHQVFQEIISKNSLLYDTRKNQPDFFVTVNHSEDSDLLRQIILEGTVIFAEQPAAIKKATEQPKKASPCRPARILFPDEPLAYSPLSGLGARDLRRSHIAWQTRNPTYPFTLGTMLAANLTTNETGSTLSNFLYYRAMCNLNKSMRAHGENQKAFLPKKSELIRLEEFLKSVTDEHIRTLTMGKISKLEEEKSALDATNKALIAEVKRIKAEFTIANFLPKYFKFPRDVYTDTWHVNEKPRPRAYNLEGTLFAVNKLPEDIKLIKYLMGQAVLNFNLLKMIPKSIFNKYIKQEKNSREPFYKNLDRIITPGQIISPDTRDLVNISSYVERFFDTSDVGFVRILQRLKTCGLALSVEKIPPSPTVREQPSFYM